ncbi:MAG: type II CRISPR-associated endonuclease Cas1 [Thermoguttaceae bacterium]|nr:type II CRISPR-associated endonuclease Cas1 [Thermoguttaceae bacterium]
MQGRILDFSQAPVKLRVRYRQLIVSLDGRDVDAVPLDDVAVVLLSHPHLSLSLATLQGLTAAGASIVVCDAKSSPCGLCLPLVGHHLSARRTRLQASVSRPLQKRLWRQIVRSKIEGQASVLETLRGDDGGLRALSAATLSGDSDNREGVAAKKYWSQLFNGERFKRDYNGGDPTNAALNYGYGALRAIVARAVVASGLCPAFGIFHRNKYDAFALADDLIEPFRPVVDVCVARLRDEKRLSDGLSTEIKSTLIRQLTGRYRVEGFQETIFEAASKATESLARVYVGKDKRLTLPDALPLAATNAEAPRLKTENVALVEKASTQKGLLSDVEEQNSRCEQVAVPVNNDETEVVEKEWVEVVGEADDEELDLRLDGFFNAYVDWDYESDFRLDDDY